MTAIATPLALQDLAEPVAVAPSLLSLLGRLADEYLAERNAAFEGADARAVVAWAVQQFGSRLVVTTSMTDAVLVDLVVSVDPSVEIVFLDTGYHFAETLETLERVRRRYPHTRFSALRSPLALDNRWQSDPDGCCAVRKVSLLDRALDGKDAWMTGVRRADGPSRADTAIVSRDRRGVVKVNPIATWTDEQVDAYIAAHDIIVNPLVAQGYPSIGCAPCTRPVGDGEHARAGRWEGFEKTECGLHW